MSPSARRTRSDAELLAASSGDPRAFGMFYDRHERLVAGYLMRRTGRAELAADLTAEVFAAALAAAGRFRPVGESAAGWLLTIAHNTLASSLRRGAVEDTARRRIEMDAVIELRETSLRSLEALVVGESWAEELLVGLPEAERTAVRARILEERSYDEIAAELETSPLVVRKRVSRGLARLRNQLRERET